MRFKEQNWYNQIFIEKILIKKCEKIEVRFYLM